jgi:hypothetical protein
MTTETTQVKIVTLTDREMLSLLEEETGISAELADRAYITVTHPDHSFVFRVTLHPESASRESGNFPGSHAKVW